MRRSTLAALAGLTSVAAGAALASPVSATAKARSTPVAASFSYGEPQAQTVGASGCATNTAGEPSLHVSKANLVGLGSENGIGGGSVYWRASQVGGSGAGACACALSFSGQPNAVSGVGAAGGDIDRAFAPVKDPTTGTYRIYVASLNLASINVATSTDDGKTFSQVPVQAGVPVDDREWIAAYGPKTSLLTYHDIASNNIDVLRSDTGGGPYTQIATAIPATDYKAQNNELGNIVVDHNNDSPIAGGFYAYQSFVAPSTDPGPSGAVNGAPYNERSSPSPPTADIASLTGPFPAPRAAAEPSTISSPTSPSPRTAPWCRPGPMTPTSSPPSPQTTAAPGSAPGRSAPRPSRRSSRGSWPAHPASTWSTTAPRMPPGRTKPGTSTSPS